MHAILPNLMAVALLAHALLGCCWHHAHNCVQCDKPTPAAARSVACCKHNHGQDQQKQQPTGPCKCKLECAGVCTFLPTQKTQIEKSQLAATYNLAAIVPALSDYRVPSEFAWMRTSDAAGAELPLSLHLLNQVLLI